MPKKNKGKKITFYVVSCSAGSDITLVWGMAVRNRENKKNEITDCKRALGRCSQCDAQIHKVVAERKG